MDKFYTNNDVARDCIWTTFQVVPPPKRKVIIEPSAGGGAFLQNLPGMVIAMDIEPAAPGIIRMDFLEETLDISGERTETMILGNPPFGWCANHAIKFFNRSAMYADTIAFILPVTFRKRSTHKKIDAHYHLIHDNDIPDTSFTHEDQPYKVATCFQIWERRCKERVERPVPKNIWLEFVARKDAQYAIRRVGRRAGEVVEDWSTYSSKGLWFVREKQAGVIDAIRAIGIEGFHGVSEHAVGSKSISKDELMYYLEDYYRALDTG